MKYKSYFLSLLLIFNSISVSFLFAQSTVTGKVVSNTGDPVINAMVSIEKLSLFSLTDSSGRYTLHVPSDKLTGTSYTITISCIGYFSGSRQISVSEKVNNADFILAENYNTLNGVEVSALKSGNTLAAKTPIAISVFSGKYIERLGASTISEFIQQAPGVSTTQLDEAYMNLQIRGISSLSGDCPAGYYLDDLPFTFISSPLVPDVNPFDLERVEVLRGPQGTLYGNGAQSGVVRILTQDADPTKLKFKVDLSTASTLHGGPNYGAQGALNVPVVKNKLALRLTGGFLQRGGFLTNNLLNRKNVNEQQLSYFRGKINYKVTERLTFRGSFWTQKNDVGTMSLADDNFDRSNPFEEEANNNTIKLYNGTIEYKFPKIHIYSATSYTNLDATQNDGSPIFARSDSRLNQKAFNEEFRVNSVNKGPVNWLAGLYTWNGTFNQTTNIAFPLPMGGVSISPYLDTKSTSRQFAGFGEFYYKFHDDKILATVGLRYFSEKRDLEDKLQSTTDFLKTMGIPAKRGKQSDIVSPRFNLAFNTSKKSMIYVTAAKGFRSGFVQSGAFYASAIAFGKPAPEYVKNESLWSYEIGTKATTRDNRFTIESAVYYNDWKELIQTTSEIVMVGTTPTPIIYFLNSGKAAAIGLDLNTQLVCPVGLTFNLGGNINKSEYKEDAPPSIGAKKGDRISFVPSYTLSVATNYSHKVSKMLTGSFYVNLQQSDKRVDYNNGKKFEGDEISMLNMRLGIEGKKWGVFLFGNNLLNERGATYPSSALTYNTRLRPRTLGVNIKFNY